MPFCGAAMHGIKFYGEAACRAAKSYTTNIERTMNILMARSNYIYWDCGYILPAEYRSAAAYCIYEEALYSSGTVSAFGGVVVRFGRCSCFRPSHRVAHPPRVVHGYVATVHATGDSDQILA